MLTSIQDVIKAKAQLLLAEASPDLLREIQSLLRGLNYYSGQVDGTYGPQTAKAWQTFKQVHSLSNPTLITIDSLDILTKCHPIQKQPYEVGYVHLWSQAVVHPDRLEEIDSVIARILAHQSTYKRVETETGVPWWWVAVIHHREADGDFSCHLANGDPLSDRTYHVPVGLPRTGEPPFSWDEGAIAALQYDEVDQITNWSIASSLYQAERYNGLGYFHLNVNSPYVWAGTNIYTRGKFTADGIYDSDAVDSQLGVAALIGRMIYKELITEPVA